MNDKETKPTARLNQLVDGAQTRKIEILLVEDNPDDVELTMEALTESKVENKPHVARDGVEALAFLRKEGASADAPTPDVIFLDLNMPRMNGRELLAELKADVKLRHIPVVILTTSKAEEDIVKSYQLQAAAYVTKPVDFDRFVEAIQAIDSFWLRAVTYAPRD